jgi:signal transduction histidine kinase
MRDQNIQRSIATYAAQIAGAALRHDFAIPLGVIGRSAGFVTELMEEAPPQIPSQDKKRLEQFCAALGFLSDNLTKAIRDLGREIRVEIDSNRIDNVRSIYSKSNVVIAPMLADLLSLTTTLDQFIKLHHTSIDNNVNSLIHSSLLASRQIQVMYSGLNFFLIVDRIDDDYFSSQRIRKHCLSVMKTVVPTGSNVETIVEGEGRAECTELHLSLALQNLVANAVKYSAVSSRPVVRIHIVEDSFTSFKSLYKDRLDGYEAPGRWVAIHILDNGPGIPEEFHEQVFSLYFSRSNHAKVDKSTGMGLAISRFVATIHRGLLFLEKESKYTDFVLLIPQKRSNGLDVRLLARKELAVLHT